MGERSAVRPKSGKSVRQSDPGLRRPTPPSTAGRKPAARPPLQLVRTIQPAETQETREAGLAQHKTGQGAGQSPAERPQREALGTCDACPDRDDCHEPHLSPLCNLDDSQLAVLIDFFRILDRWDREAHGKQSM